MWARMDRLLWKNNEAEARRMLPYVDATDKTVAEARLALATQDRNAEIWLAHVPHDALNDPGLLFQKLRWYIKNNRDDEANDILMHPPTELGNPDMWWEQRQIEIRRAMARHDYAMAYDLALRHAQTEPKTLVQAEFMCGWLALRFLQKPDIALSHFQNLYDNASTPVSRARGAYWIGRADEELGDKNAAEQAYEDAAVFNTAYYGQLAATRLYDKPTLTAKQDPPLPDSARRAIESRDIYRAILRLNDVGELEHARTFFHAAADAATERAEFIILTEIALHMKRPDLGIQAVKAANQKNMLVENGGFPMLTLRVPTPPEPAFTHALIRQESLFNPDAESAVGARGLMQLMPGTAKDTAKKLGIRYSQTRLLDADYSLKLGTAFVQEQIDHFNGSYILALAGYNAGPGRVHEWISAFGDPRSLNVDPIDWVESIPVQETRNYVQRIMENLQIYRAKLAGGQAPLLIINDLKR
jgi:soluble lytic murein transglycosylase